MSKQSARKLTLALTLLALTAPGLRSAIAQSTPPPPPPPPPSTPQTVTGGDPVPTSPNVVDFILTILHVA